MMSQPIHLRAPLLSASTTINSNNINHNINNNNTTSPSPSATHEPSIQPHPSEHNPKPLPTLPTTNQLLGRWHVTHSTLPMWKDKRNVSITYALLPPLIVSSRLGSTSSAGSARPTDDPTSTRGAGVERKLTRLDDTVRYQKKQKRKKTKNSSPSDASGKGGSDSGSGVSTVTGIDMAINVADAPSRMSSTELKQEQEQEQEQESESKNQMRWRWKGTGLLTRWFSSEWEVLGFGVDDDKGKNGKGRVDKDRREVHSDGGGDEDEDEARNYWVVTYFSKTLVTPAGIDILSRRPAGPAKETVGKIREALREVPDRDVRRLEGMIFEVETEAED